MVIKHINKYKKLIIIVKIGNLKIDLYYVLALKFVFQNFFISANNAFMLIAAVLSFSSKTLST
jgi:hypothetical protein